MAHRNPGRHLVVWLVAAGLLTVTLSTTVTYAD